MINKRTKVNSTDQIPLEKLYVFQHAKKFFSMTEHEGLLSCLQKPVIGPCTVPVQYNPYSYILLNIYLISSLKIRV